jgi:SAM-dependent methyltransferase
VKILDQFVSKPMPIEGSQDVLAPMKKIMQRHGVRCTAEEFHAAVNITFHNFESEVYDQEHADMWESLPREFDRLAGDCARVAENQGELNLLDIGCGTGLATDCLVKSELGTRITYVDLLDTSRPMLAQAARRAAGWNRPFTIYEGLVDALPKVKKYSLIVTCSVLHHVPDLAAFLRTVRSLQADNGIYIHLQDPNGDYANDPEYLQRVAQIKSKKLFPEVVYRFTPRRVVNRIYRELTGKQDDSYCTKTNRALLNAGLISTPLSVTEIYSITDIHVLDGTGISIRQMKDWMPDYDLISMRSYAFFGTLWSKLPPKLKREEEALGQIKARNGMHIGAVWKLRTVS